MLYSPLHLIWAGGEAVFVFFVLSGLVLALPAAAGRRMQWRSYYPSRLVRLYLPIVAAVVLAFILVRLVPRHPGPGSSWWLASHTSPVGWRQAAHDAAVVRGASWLNSPLWSLQWEVIFSLLLPVFVLLLVRSRGLLRLKVISLLTISVASPYLPHSSYFLYMPVFGFGVVMAQQIGRLDRWGVAFDSLRNSLKVWAIACTGLLLISSWLLKPLPSMPGESAVGLLLTLMGVCLVVWLFACTSAAGAFGTTDTVRWLGRRSFSLYLVHEPIVVTVAYLLGATRDAALVLVIALPVSLLVTEAFGRICEAPSHRLAKRVGSRFKVRTELVAE